MSTDFSIQCATHITSKCAEGEYYDDLTTQFGPRLSPPKVVDTVQGAIEAINALSIQGPQGAQGPQGGGPQGAQGDTGAQGAQGPTGGVTDVGFFVGTLQAGALSIPDSINTTLKWPNSSTQPYNDVGGNYSSSSGIYTIPTTGFYSFSSSLVPTASNGVGIRSLVIRRNGGATERDILGSSVISSNSSAISDALNVSADHVYCTAGDDIECIIYQTSGGSLSVYGNFGGFQVA